MPKTKLIWIPFFEFIEHLLNNYPNLFPLLQRFLQV